MEKWLHKSESETAKLDEGTIKMGYKNKLTFVLKLYYDEIKHYVGM